MILQFPMLAKQLIKSLLISLIFIGFTQTVNAQCPVIDAGPAATICETGTYTTASATGSDYASVLWTSNGTGNFINADQLITAFKSVLNNAKSYAFTLAMETATPQLSNVMKYLNKTAQEINSLNINSCETAVGLVGSVWPRTQEAQRSHGLERCPPNRPDQ